MCGIVTSPQLQFAAEIAHKMRTRGTRAWSVSVINLDTLTLDTVHESLEKFSVEHVLSLPIEQTSAQNRQYVIHVQSPTAITYRFHPARDEHGRALWHNGMLESYELHMLEQRAQNKLWDTEVLLSLIDVSKDSRKYRHLERFLGSFSCYFLEKDTGFFAFRNRISPQYVNPSIRTFASIQFPGSQRLDPGIVVDILTGDTVAEFRNDTNPFGV